MSIRAIAVAAGFAAAIGITALFGSFAASATVSASKHDNVTLAQTIPNYVLRWENPMLPPAPAAPILGP